MHKRNVIALVLIVGIAIVALVIWLKPDHLTAQPFGTATASVQPSTQSENTPVPLPVLSSADIQKRVQEGIARRRFTRLDEAKLEQGAAQTAMFQASDAKAVAALNPIKLTEAQQHDGRAFISYDLYTLEGKGVGDRIQFKVPQVGINRTAVIDQIKVDSQDDIIAYTGHLENGDQNLESFYISQTVKDNYSIGTITTIDGGMYSVETKNGAGWISNRPDGLDKGHDHEHSDALTPSAPPSVAAKP